MFNFKCSVFLLISYNILSALSASVGVEEASFLGKNLVVVNTSTGLVQGEQGGLIGNSPWYRFRGIPFAEPPVGSLRFEPPVKKLPWTGILDATKKGSSCIQGSDPIIGSEDCLFVEVYTPQYPARETKLPVIVYTYGGAYYTGALDFEGQSPNHLLAEDVIIAAFEYRLGAFGFLATGDNTISGNAGLKDQVLALEWIKENIENFGGDPERITLLGQSAGASSIAYLLQAPQTKGLYTNAIMLSGSSLNSWALSRNPLNFAKSVASNLKVSTSSVSAMVQGLKSVSAEQLQAAVASQYNSALLQSATGGLPLGPVIEPNNVGAVVTGNSHELLKNGNFNAVPIIIGHTSLEARTPEGFSDALKLLCTAYNLLTGNFVPVGMNIDSFFTRTSLGQKIKSQYSVGSSDVQSLQWLSDDQFVRGIYEYVRQYSKKAPVYYYSFSQEGSLFGIKERAFSGVGHNEDLGYLFDFGYSGSEEDESVRAKFVKLITNFAKYNNPTPQKENLLQNIQWPANTGGTIKQLNIKSNLEIVSDPNKANMEFWQKFFEENGKPPFSTY